MKKYIGTKEVEAEPMTMGEAYEKGLLQVGRIPRIDQKDKPGYHVKYKDGFGSWRSAELFEERYKLADTALDRMLIEGDQLTEKLQKLQMFACTSKFMELDVATKAMLVAQACVMQDYQTILNQRYTKMESGQGNLTSLSGSTALTLLKVGFVAKRKEWNGKCVFMTKQSTDIIVSSRIYDMQLLPSSMQDDILKNKAHYNCLTQFLVYDENTGCVDLWSPSTIDLLAEDWEIVTE